MQHQTALKALLVDRRGRIDPAAHGLPRPTRQGRRAPGLTQHNVDKLTSRAPGTYERLESGRWSNPPVDYLRDIARLFALSEQEWVTLCRYTRDEEPPGPLWDSSGRAVPGAWEDAVHGVLHPAYVTDASWQLLTHNTAFAEMFKDGRPPSNTMRWMLFDGRDQLTDWERAWAPFVIPQLRIACGRRPGDPILTQLEQEVRADPCARTLYREGTVADIHPDGDERPIHHAALGAGWVTMCVAQPLAAPGARFMMLIFRPGPRQTGRHRPMLQAG
ncbi:helix-turn-helix domain-containing protein [Streptomyces sp. NPDC008150]|uniref:MmyB family transcriptional regulator n=1 Tax=Streptomyces sp. NPDC008150 TaxID=3364816 RepID=UPI0036EC39B2